MNWKKFAFMSAWLPVTVVAGAGLTVGLRALGVGEVVLAFTPMMGVCIAWVIGQVVWASIARRS